MPAWSESDSLSGSICCGILSYCMGNYWTGSSTKHRLRYHVVWLPKYRKRILQGSLVKRLTELFYQACEVNHWYIHELKIMTDHIHVLIQINPTESLSKVVQILKGGTSKKIREEYRELEEFLWGDSLWCDGYFAETIGHLDENTIRKYIQNKKEESIPQKKKYSGF